MARQFCFSALLPVPPACPWIHAVARAAFFLSFMAANARAHRRRAKRGKPSPQGEAVRWSALLGCKPSRYVHAAQALRIHGIALCVVFKPQESSSALDFPSDPKRQRAFQQPLTFAPQ